MRQSSRTETTQLLLSNEPCGKLRDKRYDETADLIGATPLTGGAVGCWHVPSPKAGTTECGLFPTLILFISKDLKNKFSLSLMRGCSSVGEHTAEDLKNPRFLTMLRNPRFQTPCGREFDPPHPQLILVLEKVYKIKILVINQRKEVKMKGFCGWHETIANIFLHIIAGLLLIYGLFVRSVFWIIIAILTAGLGHLIEYFADKKAKKGSRRK